MNGSTSTEDSAGQVSAEQLNEFINQRLKSFHEEALRHRHAESFTQMGLEATGLTSQWARRILGGKWECTPHGWLWVKEFADNGLPREEFSRLRKKA